MSDPQLQAYAETLNVISKQDTYVDPGKGWEGGNIKIDLIAVSYTHLTLPTKRIV